MDQVGCLIVDVQIMTGERSMFSSYSPMTHSNENIVFGDNSKGDVIDLHKVAITLEHSITMYNMLIH